MRVLNLNKVKQLSKEILIVDDEPTLLFVLNHYLSPEGYSVTKANNGEQAFDLTKKINFDFIISDISMPIMDGITFFQKLREQDNLTPFLFITAYEDKVEGIDSLNLPYNGFIVKPCIKENLLSILKENLK